MLQRHDILQALSHVETHKDPQASHNCFAYKIGDEFRSSDDGEPGGTAGRPILSAIEGEGLNGICVMVTRSGIEVSEKSRVRQSA